MSRPKNPGTFSWKLQYRPLCQLAYCSASPVYKLETRSWSLSHRCSYSSLETFQRLRVSSLQSHSSGSEQGCSSQGRSSACSPSFTSSTMVDILLSLLISYPVTASVDTFCRIHPIRTGYIQQYIQCTHVSIISPWRISSNAIKQRAFLNRLPNYSYQPLGLPVSKLII